MSATRGARLWTRKSSTDHAGSDIKGSTDHRSLTLGQLSPRRSSSADSVLPVCDIPATAAVPAPMGPAASRRHFQHLLLSFAAGIIVTYAATAWLPGLRHPYRQLHTNSTDDLCVPTKAPGVSLAPMALARVSGNHSATTDRLIVCARHDEDTSWLDVYLSDVPHIIYQVDDPEETQGAQHATLANKGNEAMAFLQFIIDYYDRLPESLVFIHGGRKAWHLQDHVPLMRRLRWDTVAVPFANLRFDTGPDHHLKFSCEVDKGRDPFIFDCDWVGNHLRPGNMPLRSSKDMYVGNKDEWEDSVELEQAWGQLYLAELGPIPSELHAPCCAEFMVARERILAHPLAFYVHLRDWILDTELNRYRSGRVFEYVWHYIFGEPAVIKPVPECDLLTCDNDDFAVRFRAASTASRPASHVHPNRAAVPI